MIETRVLPGAAPESVNEAVKLLKRGELVAFPTDTVYGVAALVQAARSIDRLFEVKGREANKSIAVLIGRFDNLPEITGEISTYAQKLAENFWPGPVTLVVRGNPSLPRNLSPSPNVGVRMPDHPIALQLLQMTGPLAVTSANRSGMPDARTADEVFDQLGGSIALILDGGKTAGGMPSTVVDCTGEELVILRQGPIHLEQLLEATA